MQQGLISINQMPKINLNQPNLSLDIFVDVLSKIMVTRRYNEQRSTIFWLVKRVNVIETAIGHQRSG